jgi:hypothetical protein
MSGRENEAERRQMLHLVESAQRDGYSETEITEIVNDAIEADAELDAAA